MRSMSYGRKQIHNPNGGVPAPLSTALVASHDKTSTDYALLQLAAILLEVAANCCVEGQDDLTTMAVDSNSIEDSKRGGDQWHGVG
jgi:hypothetical protein